MKQTSRGRYDIMILVKSAQGSKITVQIANFLPENSICDLLKMKVAKSCTREFSCEVISRRNQPI